MCFIFIWEQTASYATYSINRLVFYNRDEKCLQRGRDRVFKYSGLRLVFKGLKYTLRKNHKHTAASSVKQIAKKYAGKYTMCADS